MGMDRYIERRKDEEFSVRKNSATSNDRVVQVRYETVTLARVEMSIEAIFSKKENRKQANAR